MQIRFNITKELIENLPEEDYEVIEMAQDGEVKLYKLRPLLARFLVDEENKPVAHPSAMKQLGKIPLPQWGEVVSQFAAALKGATVPNTSGNSLNSPSVPVSENSEFPAGSQP